MDQELASNPNLLPRFKKILNTEDPDLKNVIFLTIPSSSQDVPLFSNDFNRALFYCLNGIFGSYPDLRWYGSIYVDGTGFGKDSVQLSYQPPATINISLSKPNAFFLFPGDPQIGQQYQLATETVTIQSVRKDGRVTGFARDLSDLGTLNRSSIYYFDGDRFQEITLSDNSE